MWLPDSLYEKAPQYWLFLGLLLVVLGVYLGMEVSHYFLYLGLGCGLACCAWGFRVISRRARRQSEQKS
jgi:hypothetical protein